MKKNSCSYLLLVGVLIGSIFSACNNSSAPKTDEKQGSINNHPSEQIKKNTIGTNNWNVNVVVGDAKGAPISGALVSAPCTGIPAKTSNSAGLVEFSGAGSCPCANAQATVTTSKGCNVKINVSCDSTYNVTCNE